MRGVVALASRFDVQEVRLTRFSNHALRTVVPKNALHPLSTAAFTSRAREQAEPRACRGTSSAATGRGTGSASHLPEAGSLAGRSETGHRPGERETSCTHPPAASRRCPRHRLDVGAPALACPPVHCRQEADGELPEIHDGSGPAVPDPGPGVRFEKIAHLAGR